MRRERYDGNERERSMVNVKSDGVQHGYRKRRGVIDRIESNDRQEARPTMFGSTTRASPGIYEMQNFPTTPRLIMKGQFVNISVCFFAL